MDFNSVCETTLNDDDLVSVLSWLVDLESGIVDVWQKCLENFSSTRLERITYKLLDSNAIQSKVILCSIIDHQIEWKSLFTEMRSTQPVLSRLIDAGNRDCLMLLVNAGLTRKDIPPFLMFRLRVNPNKSSNLLDLIPEDSAVSSCMSFG